jgi:hypothetical protein
LAAEQRRAVVDGVDGQLSVGAGWPASLQASVAGVVALDGWPSLLYSVCTVVLEMGVGSVRVSLVRSRR